MRIAFLETRDKTRLFQAVAERLGHEIHWLVQNAAFAGAGKKNVTLLQYPRRSKVDTQATSEVEQRILDRVAASDRTILYFGRSSWHYHAYYDQIEAWFDETQPDLIFGEPGSFWTQIVSLIAEDRGIPFLNPITSRYPTGRFAFFEYDRLTPFGGQGCELGDEQLDRIVDDINAGRVRPDYMTARRTPWTALKGRAALLNQWLRGERFTAQSPALFVRSARALRENRERWDAAASPVAEVASAGRVTLFPLQMQPEMNLDVWGVEYRDQLVVMTQLADQLELDSVQLWVKPNPKSFYELSAELTRAAIDHPNIRLIRHDVPMLDVIDYVDLVVTVSGSIAIERLLAGRPVVVLQEDYASWIGAVPPNEHEITPSTIRVSSVQPKVAVGPQLAPRDVIRRLIATSYPGVISEPSYMPGVLSERNVEDLRYAFSDVIKKVDSRTH